MPTFLVEKNGKQFRVEAPDMNEALTQLGNFRPEPPQEGNAAVFKEGAASPDNTAVNAPDAAGYAMGNSMLMGAAPYMGGGINYAMEGGAPGSFDRGYNQSDRSRQRSEAQHPTAFAVGTGAGIAADAALIGGPPAVGAVRAAAQNPGTLGWLARSALNYFLPGTGTLAEGAMRAAPLARAAMRGAPQRGRPELNILTPRGGGRGVSSGASPHERINSLADALRNRTGTLSREDYMKRAATYTRRGASYQHRANTERDYPEQY